MYINDIHRESGNVIRLLVHTIKIAHDWVQV